MDSSLDRRFIANLVYITKPDIFLDRCAELGEALEDRAKVTMVFSWIVSSDIDAVYEESTSVIINDSEKNFGKGGLAYKICFIN